MKIKTWIKSKSYFETVIKFMGILGIIGFLFGFLGPMIFAPGANQGPMLGIFITGPAGLVIGAFVGIVYNAIIGRGPFDT